MKTAKLLGFGLALIFLFVLISPSSAAPIWDRNPSAFEHGIALDVNGETLYFAGPGSIQDLIDVPGHTWVQTGPNRVVGRHYNVGPWFLPPNTPWWATNEPYGVLLFKVDGIIDVPPDQLTEREAYQLKQRGYVHVHELVYENGVEYEDRVVYLKHTAVRAFDLNGGPAPGLGHYVTPGIDYAFIPNW